MKYDPLLIANRIVELKSNKLTIMELLKLAYIAHGYSLALLNEPLFDSSVEAWPYGPVVPQVYTTFRKQGIDITNTLPIKVEKLSSSAEEVINAVVQIYGNKDAWKLSALTHEENAPWTQTVAAKGFYSLIPDELTKTYYKGLVQSGAAH